MRPCLIRIHRCVSVLFALSISSAISVTCVGTIAAQEPAREADSDVNIPLAGHSDHGEAFNEGPRQNAYRMGGTGAVDFPITTDIEKAQAFFDQGLGQLYGFWYYEAERSFRRVAALDPECAMAYWGMARANDENKDRAKLFIAEAVAKKEKATEREKMYIDALDAMLNADGDDIEEKKYRQDYIQALEKIIGKFPADTEAKAMLAVYLWQSDRHGVPINSHQAVDSLIGDIFRVAPMHSAHHFRIHLWDRETPERALESAAQCGPAAPSIAHMWHMPGHIYSRLKRFDDAVYQQEASARADHAHMIRDGVLPDQIHNYAHNNEWLIRNLVHLGRRDDAISLAKNMLELPRHPKYNSFEKDGMCSCKYGRLRLLQVLESFGMWDDVITISKTMYLEPTETKEEQGKRWRMLGLAHYHRGEFQDVARCCASLENLLTAYDKSAKKAGRSAAKEKRNALDAAAEKNKKEADKPAAGSTTTDENDKATDKPAAGSTTTDENDKATDKPAAGSTTTDEDDKANGGKKNDNKSDGEKTEANGKQPEKKPRSRGKQIADAREKAEREANKGRKSVEKAIAELTGLQFLSRGMTDEAIEQFKKSDIPKPRLAVYQFLAGDHKKANSLCEQAVKSGENEVRPLATQVDLLRRMGKQDEAREAFERLRTVAGVADLHTPLLVNIEKFAKELELPSDWRQAPEPAQDLGERPDLDLLGPLRWAPAQAIDWELPNHHGDMIALSDYRQRPVIVIFYLGAGCLHCVEQLHEFIPMLADFDSAGVDVVAISSETTKELSAAVKNFSSEGAFPMTLVANPELDVFKEYRAFDDFEKMPLHGTFLIDGKGMVRWHDISYEPFLDAEFLLKECKRILSLDDD